MNIDIWLQSDLRLSRSQVVGGEEKGGVIVRTVRPAGFRNGDGEIATGLVMLSCLDKYKLVCRSLELHLILGFYSNISTAGMQKPSFLYWGRATC